MPLGRRGASLVEVMVALAMLSVVATVLLRMLAANQRIYQSQTQRIDRRQTIRAAETILPADLRELDAADGDILALSPTSITVRAMRQLGFVCAQPRPGDVRLAIRERPIFGLRDFDPATDSLLVYVSGDSTTPDANRWIARPLVSVQAGTCGDGAPARLLETSAADPEATTWGTPVRGFEIVTYRLYRANDGQWQIGIATGPSGVIQPLIGPVTSTGLELTYLDAAGSIVAEPARVATIEIKLRAPTVQPIRQASGALERPLDSSAVVVALRNNRRP